MEIDYRLCTKIDSSVVWFRLLQNLPRAHDDKLYSCVLLSQVPYGLYPVLTFGRIIAASARKTQLMPACCMRGYFPRRMRQSIFILGRTVCLGHRSTAAYYVWERTITHLVLGTKPDVCLRWGHVGLDSPRTVPFGTDTRRTMTVRTALSLTRSCIWVHVHLQLPKSSVDCNGCVDWRQ